MPVSRPSKSSHNRRVVQPRRQQKEAAMPEFASPAPLTAVVYSEGVAAERLLQSVAKRLEERGHALAGFLQRDEWTPGRARCDMVLAELHSDTSICVSQDLGPGSRGCRLDMAAMVAAMAKAIEALSEDPDLLIINKFGKTESEGGGFRPLISAAVERGVPVLIAVPRMNVEAWRTFAGDLGVEHVLDALPADGDALLGALGFAARAPADATT